MSQALKQSKIQILDLPQLAELNKSQQRQVRGGAELLTTTRYYFEADGLDELQIYQIEGLH
jgi:hypothetical protein